MRLTVIANVEVAMSRVSQAVHNDVQMLEMLRDELRVQAHLMQAEIKEHFEKLEAELEHVSSRVKAAAKAGAESEQDTEAGLELTLESIKTGMKRVSDALRS